MAALSETELAHSILWRFIRCPSSPRLAPHSNCRCSQVSARSTPRGRGGRPSSPPACCANILPPPVVDPGVGGEGKYQYRFGIGCVDGMLMSCEGLYNDPAIAAVGNGKTDVYGESRTP